MNPLLLCAFIRGILPIVSLLSFQAVASSAPVFVNNYVLEEVASSGGTYSGFEANTSLNNLGHVAFVARLGTGLNDKALFVFDGQSTTRYASGRISRFFQINDASIVAGQDFRSSPDFVKTFIRLWSRTEQRSIAEAGVEVEMTTVPIEVAPGFPVHLPVWEPRSLAFDVVYVPSINNNESVCYAGSGGIPGQLYTAVMFEAADADDKEAISLLDLAENVVAVRPVISDVNSVLLRVGSSNSSPIIHYSMSEGGSSARLVAGSDGGTRILGSTPGMSDDGKTLAWASSDLAGTVSAIAVEINRSPALSLAHSDLQAHDPGEFSWVIHDGAPREQRRAMRLSTLQENTVLKVASIPIQERVSVNRASGHGEYRIVFGGEFTGTANAALPALFTAVVGMRAGTPKILVPPYPLVSSGQQLPSGPAWTSFASYDAANNSNQVAFWSKHGTVEKVHRVSILFDPLRQNQLPWATNQYASRQWTDFVNRVNENPLHEDRSNLPWLQRLSAENLNNISGKGCVLSSLSMAANILWEGRHELWTPELLNQALDQDAGFSPITSIQRNADGGIKTSSATGLPIVNGQDARPEVYERLLRITSEQNQKQNGETYNQFYARLWNYLASSEEPRVIMAVRHGHRFLLVGLTENLTRNVYIVDPYVNRLAPNYKDTRFGLSDLNQFSTTLHGPNPPGSRVKYVSFLERHNPAAPPPEGQLRMQSIKTTIKLTGSPGLDFAIMTAGGKRIGFTAESSEPVLLGGATYVPQFPIIDPEAELTEAELLEIEAQSPKELSFDSSESGPLTIEVLPRRTGEHFLTASVSSGGTNRTVQVLANATLEQGLTRQFPFEADTKSARLELNFASVGDIHLKVLGPPGKLYVIEKSQDLIQWQESGSITLDSAGSQSLLFRTDQSKEFYRLKASGL
jgi:hypothetical protein